MCGKYLALQHSLKSYLYVFLKITSCDDHFPRQGDLQRSMIDFHMKNIALAENRLEGVRPAERKDLDKDDGDLA